MLFQVERARVIVAALTSLAAAHGYDGPPRFSGAATAVRYVDFHKNWSAYFYSDCRRVMRQTSKTVVRSDIVHTPGCTLIELSVFGVERLIVNVREGEIELYKFIPGIWEKMFGSDAKNDTVATLPDLFADPKEASWRAFRDSPEGQWPDDEDPSDNSPDDDGPFTPLS